MLLILYTVWGFGSSEVLRGVDIISSRVFGHLRSFKGWIQAEACVISLVDFAILGTTKSPEFCDLRERVGL